MRLVLCLTTLAGATLASATPAWANDGPRVLFSPSDDVEQSLVAVLQRARTSVDLAMTRFQADTRYGAQDFDDHPTALDTLRALVRRGVRVRIVLDRADRQADAVRHMLRARLQVYSVDGTGHHYCVIDETRVIHGSSDWTQDAYLRHHATWVVGPSDAKRARPFQQAFAALIARARPVTLSDGELRLGQPTGSRVGKVQDSLATGPAALALVAEAVRSAKDEVLLATPSVPAPLVAALEATRRRGIRVRVLVDLPAVESTLSETIEVRALTYSLAHHPPRARSLLHAFAVVDGGTLIHGSFGGPGSTDARRVDPGLSARFRAEHRRLWTLGRERHATFVKRLQAAPQSTEYRRFIPCHFPAMALTPREVSELRASAHGRGFSAAARTFWHFDRETRAGTNSFPSTGHEPFFGLQRLVISEVCYRAAKQRSGQYVELTNGSLTAIDLRGYVLSDGDSQDTLVPLSDSPTIVAPGGQALVVDPDFDGDFPLPDGVPVLTTSDRSLGNGLARGDVVSVRDPAGTVLDSCALTVETRKGEVLRRVRIGLRSYPGNWTVAKPAPGRR